ncbi:hypothetical protein LXL04_005625 [Taraxacum kok-saghyz]
MVNNFTALTPLPDSTLSIVRSSVAPPPPSAHRSNARNGLAPTAYDGDSFIRLVLSLLAFPICRLRIDDTRSRDDTGDIGGESIGVEQCGKYRVEVGDEDELKYVDGEKSVASRRGEPSYDSESTPGDVDSAAGFEAVPECVRRNRFSGCNGRRPYTAEYGSETDGASTRTHRVRTRTNRLSYTNLYETQDMDYRSNETYVDHDVELSLRNECTDKYLYFRVFTMGAQPLTVSYNSIISTRPSLGSRYSFVDIDGTCPLILVLVR